MNHLALCLFIFYLSAHGSFGHHSYFISERNITNGSPLILGYSDRLYYFTKPCEDSEITMSYAGDDNKWKIKELDIANKTFPAFVTYDDEIQLKDEDDDILIYSMIMAVNGNLFQYDPNSQRWKSYNDVGSTNKLEYEGSGTFYNYKDGDWYSPSKPNKLSVAPANEWQFGSTDDNFLDISGKIKDLELFPLVDMDERKSKNDKWILLILRECGLVEYYIGEVRNSKFVKLSGPHEFMKAENINDLAVIDRDRLTIFFNTYLRKSSSKDCTPGEWNSVIPQMKQIQLYRPTANNYRLYTQFYIRPDNGQHLFLNEENVKLSSAKAWYTIASSNSYIDTNFQITTETTEVGLMVRQNQQNGDGIVLGLDLKEKFYFYNKGRNYSIPKGQEYCECGCPVSQKLPISYEISNRKEFSIVVLVDGPVVDVIFFESFIFTFLDLTDEHADNKITVYSKGPSIVSVSSYMYRCLPGSLPFRNDRLIFGTTSSPFWWNG